MEEFYYSKIYLLFFLNASLIEHIKISDSWLIISGLVILQFLWQVMEIFL